VNLDLGGRVAIVTGASRGLGRAAAEALAHEGVNVLAVARSTDLLDTLRSTDPERIRVAECDMLDLERVASLPALAIEAFGRLDVVVNNAGIAPAGPFVEQDGAFWNRVFTVNVFAPAALARAAGVHFIEQGAGKVINIASTSGILGKAGLVAYSSSKGAMLQMTKALAAEWARHGIQVNAIAPGAFATEAQSAVLESEELLARRLRRIPARRMADPGEIGPLVCLLASSASGFVTGAVLVADGGESSKM
jgi:2-deoxy-D-gluconate 3-dehydrogenase